MINVYTYCLQEESIWQFVLCKFNKFFETFALRFVTTMLYRPKYIRQAEHFVDNSKVPLKSQIREVTDEEAL